jgi:pyridoxamine 5'-phosphate oxidase
LTAPAGADPSLDPMALFARAFERAVASAPFDPTAAALATAGADGRPSCRMVLVKIVDAAGFHFYTNYESRKAGELAVNPRAALTWHWPWIDEQVRAEGAVERLTPEESDRYFASRPRLSQLGAWASAQSRPLVSRFRLLRDVVALEAKHLGGAVPRPPFWGGYRLRPDAIELWRSRTSRLHERRRFELRASGWREERLYP